MILGTKKGPKERREITNEERSNDVKGNEENGKAMKKLKGIIEKEK
jgi:hypothetical protein